MVYNGEERRRSHECGLLPSAGGQSIFLAASLKMPLNYQGCLASKQASGQHASIDLYLSPGIMVRHMGFRSHVFLTYTNKNTYTVSIYTQQYTQVSTHGVNEIFVDRSFPPGVLLTALIWVQWWQGYCQGLICNCKSPKHMCGSVPVTMHATHLTVWFNMCLA